MSRNSFGKIGFISRKAYNISQENYQKTYKRYQEVYSKNIELQTKIKDLEELIKVYKGEQKEAKRCIKCNNYFIPKSKIQKKCENCIKGKKEDKEDGKSRK